MAGTSKFCHLLYMIVNICFKNYEKRENNRFCNLYTEGKCHSKIHVHVAINSTLELIVFIKYLPVVLQNLFLFNFSKRQQQ